MAKKISKNKAFDVIDLTKTKISLDDLPEDSSGLLKSLGYLNDLTKKFKNGEVFNMTVIALLKNGKVSIWKPASINSDDIETLYEPLIQALENGEENILIN